MSPLPLVVLVSGRGSNLRALQHAIERDECAARIAAVISDRPGCDALAFASECGLTTRVIRPKAFTNRAAWDLTLAKAIGEHEPGLVVLAGFMRIVGEAVLADCGARIVNVHPSLLPAFPGLGAPARALEAGVRITGCTIHLVDAGVDSGPILAQAALRVRDDEDAAALHRRIQALEHRLFPHVVDAVATGTLSLDGPRWADGVRSVLFE